MAKKPTPGPGKAPSGCYQCRGTGMLATEVQQKDTLTGLMVTIYAQETCDCPKGRWLTQQWRKRQAIARDSVNL